MQRKASEIINDEYRKADFFVDGVLLTPHFHYAEGVKVSIHPLDKKNLCKEYKVNISNNRDVMKIALMINSIEAE